MCSISIHIGIVLKKYGWNHSYEPLLYGMSAYAEHVNIFCNENNLVQILIHIQLSFAVVFHTMHYHLNQ